MMEWNGNAENTKEEQEAWAEAVHARNMIMTVFLLLCAGGMVTVGIVWRLCR
jgi:hypothetical protein